MSTDPRIVIAEPDPRELHDIPIPIPIVIAEPNLNPDHSPDTNPDANANAILTLIRNVPNSDRDRESN